MRGHDRRTLASHAALPFVLAGILVAGLPAAHAALPRTAHEGAPHADASPTQAGPAVTPLGTTTLDRSAIYFVSYDGLVNNNSFQQSGILTYAGHQYAGWYTADRTAQIARRRLPDGPWETLRLPHRLSVDDSHNVITMGVSPQDGRLHIAMDTHDTPVYYVKSEAGLASEPESRSWEIGRFGAVQRTLDGVDLGGITYPRFVVTPDGRLQFGYRTPRSGDGRVGLAEYADGRWRHLGLWSDSAGSYTWNGVTSTTRNLYLHGLTYGPDGRLHAAFTWREGDSGVLCAPGGLGNHDTGYVFSDDQGRTWRNDDGQVVGTTGGDLVSVQDPGLVVDPLDVDHGLMNQESQAVDSTGRPHVVISYVPGRFTQCVTNYQRDRIAYGRPFHLVPDGDGWRKTEIPVPLDAVGRSRLVFDAADNAYVVLPYGRIVAASRASGWTDWRLLFDAAGLNAFGEVLVDEQRVKDEGVLSVMYQEASSGTTPSPLRVIDFRLGG